MLKKHEKNKMYMYMYYMYYAIQATADMYM